MRIVCGKHDNIVDLSMCETLNSKAKIRIGSSINKKNRPPEFYPIATDGIVIFSETGVQKLDDFFTKNIINIKSKLIVLTHAERNLLLPLLVDLGQDVEVFERLFPIFECIKYVSNPKKNYTQLTNLLRKISNLKIKGDSLANHCNSQSHYKLERKIRFKNKLDNFFYFGLQGGYQEVFKLKEERQERVIIALDFNSMYASSMAGDFVEPKTLEYEKIQRNYDEKLLKPGLYKVILRNVKSGFMEKYHPFKFVNVDQKYYFQINRDDEIETLLHANEIRYYSKHFNQIEIVEGLTSTTKIKHPLASDAIRLYKHRKFAVAQSNKTAENLYKYWLATLHSASNPRRQKKYRLSSLELLKKTLYEKLLIRLQKNSDINFCLWQLNKSKKINISHERNLYTANLPNYTNPECIYSLSSQVVANAKIKMLSLLELLSDQPSVELCYVNIDSVHISIHRSQLNVFFKKNAHLISKELGDLKVQAIADAGIWMDIGRYWLFKDDTVVQYKNRIFNSPKSKTPFTRRKKQLYIFRDKEFRYISKKYLNLENSLSYTKRLESTDTSVDFINYSRYKYGEIKDLNVAGDTYEKEILRSKTVKINILNSVATV